MSEPLTLKLSRPYRSLEEFLEAEADWIAKKTMLLVGAEPLPVDTLLRFAIRLENGESPIRAEARVLQHVGASADHPAGLRVRFKRYGASTKDVIDRAEAIRAGRMAGSPESTDRVSLTEVLLDEVFTSDPNAADPPPPSASEQSVPQQSGLHRRPPSPVATPGNRNELLERLRRRARQLSPEISEAHTRPKAV